MCINNKLQILCSYTLDSDKKVICDDSAMSDLIKKSKLSKKTGEELVPGNDYFFVATLEINKDQGYEINEELCKSENNFLKFNYKCFNNNIECIDFSIDIEGLHEWTKINRSNWTSGLFPDALPTNWKTKWSKRPNIELKYRVKKKMKTLKKCDLEFTYKIEKSE